MRFLVDIITACAFLVAIWVGGTLLVGLAGAEASRSFAVVPLVRLGVPLLLVATAAAAGLTWARRRTESRRRVLQLVVGGLVLLALAAAVRSGPAALDAWKRRRASPALHRACDARDAARVRALLRAGASPEDRDPRGLSAIEHAALHGSPEVLDALAEHHARFSEPDLLEHALHNPDPSVVGWLLDHAFPPRGEAAVHALVRAACLPNPEAVHTLLSRGVPAEDGFLAAARCGSIALFDGHAISAGARRRAISESIDADAPASLEHLFAHAPDPESRPDANAPDARGTRPLALAIDRCAACVDVLLAHGARLDLAVEGDRWPLRVAVERGDREIVADLLAHGAGFPDRSLRDDVARRGERAVAEELVEESLEAE
ncbi:MAG: hypothetical protein U0230_16990 [Polyangiales bacterium]